MLLHQSLLLLRYLLPFVQWFQQSCPLPLVMLAQFQFHLRLSQRFAQSLIERLSRSEKYQSALNELARYLVVGVSTISNRNGPAFLPIQPRLLGATQTLVHATLGELWYSCRFALLAW